jgi:hypothetical protein
MVASPERLPDRLIDRKIEMTRAEVRSFDAPARHAMDNAIDASLPGYNRSLALGRLHRLTSETIHAETPDAARQVVHEIERALRRERARAGHWTYDLNRHIALHVAYRAETARLAHLRARDATARAFQDPPLCLKSPE